MKTILFLPFTTVKIPFLQASNVFFSFILKFIAVFAYIFHSGCEFICSFYTLIY